MSVRKCQDEIDSREFAEWMAYYEIRPFGEEANDFRGAIGPYVNANIWRAKGSKGSDIKSYYPRFSGSSVDSKKENVSDMRMKFECFVAMHNRRLNK